jgi:methyl acetate hydrolase
VLTIWLSTGEIIADYHAGVSSLDPSRAKPFDKHTLAWIASMTKLLVSISALQAVEQGLLALDDDISKYWPQWKDPQVLDGFNGDEPILRPAKRGITLR